MIEQPQTMEAGTAGLWRRGQDFFELGKPRLATMVLVTTAVGFHLGSSGPTDLPALFATVIGTALTGHGTLALNQYIEREADSRMSRTRLRPLPDGRLTPREVLTFGLLTMLAGILFLWVAVNGLCAAVTAATALIYLLAYTPLKTRTPLCTIVGAISGALPPVAGWAAARNALGIEAWLLFAILFLWQLPHSLAIAGLYRDDYARGGFRLLPVVEPEMVSTGRQVFWNTVALLMVALLPSFVGLAGRIYLGAAVLFGCGFLVASFGFLRRRDAASARQVFLASLVYLPAVLVAMSLDKIPQFPMLP